MKRSTETVPQFRARINRAVQLEDRLEMPADVDAGGERWFLGSRVRDVGSIHSDIWAGTAAELADREAIAVLPVGGWWNEKPDLQRWQRSTRYALIVTIRATNSEIDIYTPIETAIAAAIPIAV